MWHKQKLKIEKEIQEDEARIKQKEIQREKDKLLRRERIIERLEKSKEEKQCRAQSDSSLTTKLNFSQSKPLFERLEMDYQQKFVIPEINKSRDILKKRREFMKPISRNDIALHKKKYLTDLENSQKKLKRDRKKLQAYPKIISPK